MDKLENLKKEMVERMTWLVSPSQMTGDDREFIDKFAKKIYLTAIEDAKGAMPKDKNGTHTDIYRTGFNDCRVDMSIALEALTKDV